MLVVGIIWSMSLTLKDQKKKPGGYTHPNQAQKSRASYFQNLKEDWDYFAVQSKFLRWMAIGTFLLAALVTLLEYYVNKILAPLPQFASSADYASFLGTLDGISNLIALSILLFALSRMTRSWGVGNTSLVYPVGSVLICGALASFPILITASAAHIYRRGLRFSLQAPVEAFLYSAIPLRIKGRARAFVGGLLAPVGAVAGVLLLLVELWYGSATPWLVPGAIALFALAYLVSAFIIRSQYTQALVKMLEEEDYSFLLSEGTSELSVADPATLARLQKQLDESVSHEMRVFMTQLIAQVGGTASLSILIPAIKSAPEPRTQASMLDVVAAAGVQGDALRELYTDFLSAPDAQVRQAAASGLEQLLGAKDAWLQTQWLNMINDSDARISLYALQALAGSGDFYKFEPATQKLDQLFASAAVDDKKNAINVLGINAQPASIERLTLFLEDENDQIRLAAVLNLEKQALPLGSALDEKISEKMQTLLRDPMARIRQAALQIIAKFKDKKGYGLLISALADKNPQVCGAAVDILVGLGKDVAPVAQVELNSDNPQIRKMAAVVLSRINPRQFGALIEKSVSYNLSSIYQNIGLEQALTPYARHDSVRIQIAALRESNDELSDEILYLLSALHDAQTLNVINESLHSDSSETRNLALEALESLTSPQTASLIASLFEPSMAIAQLLQLGQGALNIKEININQTLEILLARTDVRIFYLLALHVAGDVGADFLKESNAPEKAEIVPAVYSLLELAANSPDALTQQSAQSSLQKISNLSAEQEAPQASTPLSVIEKMSVLKEVPFFRNIPVTELEKLVMVCEEKKYEKGARIFNAGDPGGTLYVVANGQVGIEQEKRGSTTLLATLGGNSYFGEMSIFDNSPRSTAAVAMKDSILLALNRAPIVALTMQSSDLAFELINVLSQRIRETSDRLADTSRARPRELHKLFDQFN
jgi:HEAT repeat protein